MSTRIASKRTALLGKTRSCFLAFIVLSSLASAHAQTGASTPGLHPAGVDAQQASSPSETVSEQAVDAAAKDAAQNPVAAAISVPFQNNTYYDVGPYRRAENILLIEPVIPFRLSQNWIVISRTITPIEVIPRVSPTEGVDYGLGNIQPQFYLSPSHPGKFIWGQEPSFGYPL